MVSSSLLLFLYSQGAIFLINWYFSPIPFKAHSSLNSPHSPYPLLIYPYPPLNSHNSPLNSDFRSPPIPFWSSLFWTGLVREVFHVLSAFFVLLEDLERFISFRSLFSHSFSLIFLNFLSFCLILIQITKPYAFRYFVCLLFVLLKLKLWHKPKIKLTSVAMVDNATQKVGVQYHLWKFHWDIPFYVYLFLNFSFPFLVFLSLLISF